MFKTFLYKPFEFIQAKMLPYEIIDIILIELDDIILAYKLNRIYVIDKLKKSKQIIIYKNFINIELAKAFYNNFVHDLNIELMQIISEMTNLT